MDGCKDSKKTELKIILRNLYIVNYYIIKENESPTFNFSEKRVKFRQ